MAHLRIAFKTNETVRPAFWFISRGPDLYWSGFDRMVGAAHANTAHGLTVAQKPSRGDPPIKMSYHSSGEFHARGSGHDSGAIPWRSTRDIARPYRIATVLTRWPTLYAPSSRNLNKGGARSLTLTLPATLFHRRLYVEFFLGRRGTHPLPSSLLVGNPQDAPVAMEPLDEGLVLAIRLFRLPECVSIHPDDPKLDFWINGNDESNTAI
ncbi:hypothetical protein DFR29_11534 [Tahibacter aquaticus]|uniref:Uncharacterized protein n=1 Tax=Tahibacter aquaticus TaxID=520092 RepID=A0A4R6YPE1_9GAMM|nr:hypothetical protein [Tahibacter aquaticus]TDR39646.1 hypothetical protein DFR29_11534 [Tahibacter aquaticus]